MSRIPEYYFSVDIESDGPYPGIYSMLSIGVVLCARREGNSFISYDLDDPRNQFYGTIAPVTNNFEEEAVKVCKQGGVDRNELLISGLSPKTVISRLRSWIYEQCPLDLGRPVAVIYPGWDQQWLMYYFGEFIAEDNPFGHSGYLDVKSYYAGKYDAMWINSIKRNIPKRLKSKRTHTHNALDDAIEQAELFINVKKDEYQKVFNV
jgi:hypothetical protein